MHPMLNIGVRAARAAGKILVKNFGVEVDLNVEVKSQNDFVTELDKAAESAIIRTIQKAYPDHSFLAEESGELMGKDADHQWIIDPLDGTTNYLRGIPHFAISIAYSYKGQVQVAVVYDPLREELFTATKGAGAQLNGKRLRVKAQRDLNGALLATGFPFKRKDMTKEYLAVFAALFEHVGDMRRNGAAALDLAYVAAGRIDGFWEFSLKPWDIAAGQLIVREAGGLVADFAGGHSFMTSGHTVAGNPKVVQHLLTKARPHLPESLR
ncbi:MULTISPECIES: inositol-1-monophosphatase [Idiomarinaceae]|uniref:Inositol-1-monophosphatase n=3 Tax=Pseudidiomarina TaxID=2800384 RepID=A0A368UPE1_9GAMM|nr:MULTISPECIES: inositol-1-monophosphatase [Idiomarinaceae]MDX1525667.1 inositol-1-monophosphatase [Pseudidiomarina maritima]MRJ42593.1 inositol-1-monophosphatase [Idiomarina sp. FeN1]NCU58206.1 inositol-1-monophosphatase [Idiomarina sp. FenA--70]NCU60904.1 inositol-1-monophosphatase [Idiomarina sp. FenBw--71]PWW10324.1 myo-inositol-1(or 4)-monophosphatase [Pseudidiomarina maritima]